MDYFINSFISDIFTENEKSVIVCHVWLWGNSIYNGRPPLGHRGYHPVTHPGRWSVNQFDLVDQCGSQGVKETSLSVNESSGHRHTQPNLCVQQRRQHKTVLPPTTALMHGEH